MDYSVLVNCRLRTASSSVAPSAVLGVTDVCQVLSRASLVAQMAKSPPAMRETWVRFLDQEDPLEMGMANYSNILAWRIPWRVQPGGL